MTEFILLGFLMERNMSGYDMKQHMSISTAHFVDSSFGSIYPALKQLTQKGYIEVNPIQENKKGKKIYSINEQGKAVFLKWLDTPIEVAKSSISPVLVKIFFYQYLPKDRVRALLEQLVADIQAHRKNLDELKIRLEGGETLEQKLDPYEKCTLDFGMDMYDFTIRWCKNYFHL